MAMLASTLLPVNEFSNLVPILFRAGRDVEHGLSQLGTISNAELAVRLLEVRVHSVLAYYERFGQLPFGQAVGGKLSHLEFSR